MYNCIIMAGTPGSGKSTHVRNIILPAYPEAHTISADTFFMENSEYHFVPNKLATAHTACKRAFVKLIRSGDDVVVDNTNTTLWQVAPYVEIALAYCYCTRLVVLMKDSPETCYKRNIHSVPLRTIRRMDQQLREMLIQLPKHWRKEIIQ